MTDSELLSLGNLVTRVKVTANDYNYEGWLMVAFEKCSGAIRCVVEDDCGRLFIHNAGQLTKL